MSNSEDRIVEDRLFLASLTDRIIIRSTLQRAHITHEEYMSLVRVILQIQINASWSNVTLTAKQAFEWLVANPNIVENREWLSSYSLF